MDHIHHRGLELRAHRGRDNVEAMATHLERENL
jgi:hypothetical protein